MVTVCTSQDGWIRENVGLQRCQITEVPLDAVFNVMHSFMVYGYGTCSNWESL